MRVRVESTDRSTYPDVTVVCGPRATARDDGEAIVNPVVLVEVPSDSTEADDRGEKFAYDRRLSSLREDVPVSQRARRIEVFRRDGDHGTLHEAGPQGSITAQTTYAELVEQLGAQDARRSVGSAPGAFVEKQLARGVYVYFQHSWPGRAVGQAYVGRKSRALDARACAWTRTRLRVDPSAPAGGPARACAWTPQRRDQPSW